MRRLLLALALLVASCVAPLTPVLADQWGQWSLGPGSFGDLRWRSAVALVADLPASGNVPNDVRLVVDVDTETEGEQSQLYRWSGASWEAIGSATAGTVESVDVDVPSILTSSGGPITTSGTITIGLANVPVGHVLVGPTAGFPAAPTFRGLQPSEIPALGYADDTHATTHEDGGSDEILLEDLPTECALDQVAKSNGSGGLVCADDETGGGGSGLWDQETSTRVSLDVTGDATYDAHIEAPNATRMRLTQDAGNGSGRADAAAYELRHLNPAGYGATFGITNAAGDLFFDVISNGVTKQDALFIESATGEVGLGTTAPRQRFHVANSGAAFGLFDNTANSIGFGFGAGTVASFLEASTDLLILRAASYAATGTGVGTEVARATSNGWKVTSILKVSPLASAPATCVAGEDLYTDTSGAWCACTVTNTWENLTVTGSCT